jgi:hypothetical protein
MAARLADRFVESRKFRNAWSQTRVRPAAVVMSDPPLQDVSEMPLIEQNEEVHAFSTDCSDQSLTERVRLRSANRRLEHAQAHRRGRPIDTLGINRVSVMDDESVRLVARNDQPKLLRGPFGRGMHLPAGIRMDAVRFVARRSTLTLRRLADFVSSECPQ